MPLSPEDIARLNSEIAEKEQLKKVANFRISRQALLDAAIVTTSGGNQYDADEQSINRLTIAVIAAIDEADTYILPWSLADTDTGVMTNVTLADLKEAQKLAVLNMASIWSID